jgi:hypothetical protein
MRAIALALLLCGCATAKKSTTICAEYREMRCMSAMECSMDTSRGCQVCQCSVSMTDQNGGLPTGVPPDLR